MKQKSNPVPTRFLQSLKSLLIAIMQASPEELKEIDNLKGDDRKEIDRLLKSAKTKNQLNTLNRK